ncbi:MAG: cytochrome b/b6 domain-containing protein [Gemmatimonadota bacterium]|nr:cytochrome b/b6 domain-containing protein [Gemmatimonadota bacterium]
MRKNAPPHQILRFRTSERHVHWAIAIPFLICYTTALIMVVVYNPDPQRPLRSLFSWTHRLSGVGLIVFPLLAVTRSTSDFRVHFYNILQAWKWTFDDLKWLALVGRAAINRKIKLPEQGKFNAAEKLNFMTLLGTYPLYILTGLIIWLTKGAFLAWLVHFGMAVIATPLIVGHIFMATVNPRSRIGMSGMITGFVDRRWAKHHYAKWYREVAGETESPPEHTATEVADIELLEAPAWLPQPAEEAFGPRPAFRPEVVLPNPDPGRSDLAAGA